MEQAHCKTVEEVCAYFGCDEEAGLTDDQVKRSREKYGPNGMLDLFTISNLTLSYFCFKCSDVYTKKRVSQSCSGMYRVA